MIFCNQNDVNMKIWAFAKSTHQNKESCSNRAQTTTISLRNVTPHLSYPEPIVEETVDDRVQEAIGHGYPVNGEVEREHDLDVLQQRLLSDGRQNVKEMERKPADRESQNDRHQHLDDLYTNTKKKTL